MSVFKGAGVAIVTPMYDNEEVNYDKLGELLEEQIARGTDAIIICGTTGEASTPVSYTHLDVYKRQEFQLSEMPGLRKRNSGIRKK